MVEKVKPTAVGHHEEPMQASKRADAAMGTSKSPRGAR